MGAVRLLWIDLCSQAPAPGLFQILPAKYATTWVNRFESVATAMREFRPQLACVEFDYPDHARLQAIPTLRRTVPALPLLMFTEYHSEALAVWAFRSGVWDYRVKPISRTTLERCIEVLRANLGAGLEHRLSGPRLPADLIEPFGHLQRPPTSSQKTGMAVAYIARHFDRDLRRDALADLCRLSPSEFSRAFRREQGVTFEHFLVKYRVAMARDFLANPNMTISRAADSAGFNDMSYFSRVFRRMVGVTASEYQRRVSLPASHFDTPP